MLCFSNNFWILFVIPHHFIRRWLNHGLMQFEHLILRNSSNNSWSFSADDKLITCCTKSFSILIILVHIEHNDEKHLL
jgi:hypothetical protein